MKRSFSLCPHWAAVGSPWTSCTICYAMGWAAGAEVKLEPGLKAAPAPKSLGLSAKVLELLHGLAVDIPMVGAISYILLG